MDKRNSFKVDKGNFTKEICILMRKNAIKENKKVRELAKTQISITTDEESTYDGVAKEKKTDDQVKKHM